MIVRPNGDVDKTIARTAASVQGAVWADNPVTSDKPSILQVNPLFETANMQETAAAFRKLAQRIHWFFVDDLFFDRFSTSHYMNGFYNPLDIELLSSIDFSQYPAANLIELLRDEDPKVRTLALAALFSKDDPFVLPQVVTLANDRAESFPEPDLLAMPLQPTRLHTTTVGSAATCFVDTYLSEAGYKSSWAWGCRSNLGTGPGSFGDYWEKHKDRKYCASWFAVKLRRATMGMGMYPTDVLRRPLINAVRKQIDRIPSLDREWILLWLCSYRMGRGLYPMTIASDFEILAAMKKLGPDNLLLMLQGKIPSADPDLQLQSNLSRYRELMLFVLARAKQVLQAKQVDAILACANNPKSLIEKTYWIIAAAQLEPKRASELLYAQLSNLPAYDHGEQKADLLATLWKECGSKEQMRLIDCFYDNATSDCRRLWLEEITDHRPETKLLLRSLINDKRFDQLNDPSAIWALMTATSHNPDQERAVIFEWRQKMSHPLGEDRACRNLEKAKLQYPAETERVLAVLSQCRHFLRERVNAAGS